MAAVLGLLAGLACAIAWAVPAAAASLPPYASFYLPGLKEPFVTELEMVKLMQSCERRFREHCGDYSKENFKAIEEERQRLRNVSVVSLDVDAPLDMKPETVEKLGETVRDRRNLFLGEYFDYELDVLARYAAASDVCPTPKLGAKTIEGTLTVNLVRFWKLSGDRLEESRSRFEQLRRFHAAEVHRDFAGEACVRVRKFGALLMSLMRDRLEPYAHGTQKPPVLTRELYSGAIRTAWDMLISLELEAGNSRFEYILEDDEILRNRCRSLDVCGLRGRVKGK